MPAAFSSAIRTFSAESVLHHNTERIAAIQFCNPHLFRNAAKNFSSSKTNRYDIFCHTPPAMFIGIAFSMIIMAKTIFHFMNFIINNLNNSNLYQNNRKVKKNACIKKNRVYGIFKVLSKKVCIWIVYN